MRISLALRCIYTSGPNLDMKNSMPHAGHEAGNCLASHCSFHSSIHCMNEIRAAGHFCARFPCARFFQTYTTHVYLLLLLFLSVIVLLCSWSASSRFSCSPPSADLACVPARCSVLVREHVLSRPQAITQTPQRSPVGVRARVSQRVSVFVCVCVCVCVWGGFRG